MRSLRLAVTLVLLLSPVVLFAQRPHNLRLSTIAPANSVWDRLLKQMASEWRKVTNGRVTLRIVSGGSMGDESTVIRRMRLNNPQVAALTQSGLSEVDDAFGVFAIPFFFESDDESRHVLRQLTPRLENILADQGLVLLNWSHAGWLHIFSADPVRNLDDLKKTKLFVPSGDNETVQWYKENGFGPVPLAISDVLMGLNTGLIDAYPSPPYGALVFQWYRKVSYMLGVRLSPLLGATVMTERAWRGIDGADRAAIRKSAKATEERTWAEVPLQDRQSVDEMKERGLTVTMVDAATANEFGKIADELTASWRGRLVPTAIYDLAIRERNAYRVDKVAP